MPMRYALLIVEGIRDVEFIAKLVKEVYGLARVTLEKDLDPFFNSLVPTKYPPEGDLTKRVPVPFFLRNGSLWLAIANAEGDTKIRGALKEYLKRLDSQSIDAIGILLDADGFSPTDRFNKLLSVLKKEDKEDEFGRRIQWPEQPGEVTAGALRFGVQVLPDNQTPGVLEDVLLDCAKTSYPELLRRAHVMIDDLELPEDGPWKNDRKELYAPAGKKKAIVGCIGNVLKPEKTIQVSIQDNQWICPETMKLEPMRKLSRFLKELLDL